MTKDLPYRMDKALDIKLLRVKEDGGDLTTEVQSTRVIHDFLGYIATRANTVFGLSWLVLLVINQYRVVHLMYLLLSVPFGIYSMVRWTFSFKVNLLVLWLPPVVDIPVKAFLVRRPICTVLGDDNIIYLGRIQILEWHSRP